MKNLKLYLLKNLFPYYKDFLKKAFSMDESYYILTRFCRKMFLMVSFIGNDQKKMILGIFSSQLPDKIYHKFLVFFDRKSFCQILCMLTICEYREKTALRNIESAMGITY